MVPQQRLRRRLALAALALSLQQRPADAAERIKFDFSWRFFLGDVPDGPGGNCSAASFRSTGAEICGGLNAVPAAKTVEACVAACCAEPSCEVWQLSNESDPEVTHGSACWIGTCNKPLRNMTRGEWQGGARPTPPPPPPGPVPPVTTGPASVGYDDSAWAYVNAPHDYIIGLPYVANGSACSKQHGCMKFKDGFFPRSNGFYRKHFKLPASWAAEAAGDGSSASTFRLVFEGVYKVARVWVNGHYIEQYGDSSAAYTSFVVRKNQSVRPFAQTGSGQTQGTLENTRPFWVFCAGAARCGARHGHGWRERHRNPRGWCGKRLFGANFMLKSIDFTKTGSG